MTYGQANLMPTNWPCLSFILEMLSPGREGEIIALRSLLIKGTNLFHEDSLLLT